MKLVAVKFKSGQVGCGTFETKEGLRTDSPAGDMDSHDIVCSWCAQAHVLAHVFPSTVRKMWDEDCGFD